MGGRPQDPARRLAGAARICSPDRLLCFFLGLSDRFYVQSNLENNFGLFKLFYIYFQKTPESLALPLSAPLPSCFLFIFLIV